MVVAVTKVVEFDEWWWNLAIVVELMACEYRRAKSGVSMRTPHGKVRSQFSDLLVFRISQILISCLLIFGNHGPL
jgi:hypothetical protein